MTVESMAFTPGAEVVVCDDAGDSLSAFYQAEYPRLVGALTLYCGDRELATELAQEAMARAWRLWPRVRKFNSPAGWVHRVGINLANSAYRRSVVRRRFQDAHPVGDEGVAAPDIGTALVLRYFVDLPVDQVADIMRCRPGTVRALTTQAINSLRATGGLGDVEVSS
jgi:DNA-directed RNA polymerase specialized sigma24 family protein